MSNQFALLKTKRFAPLFLTQALGAFNDNLFKNALVILIAYTSAFSINGINPQAQVAAAAGIFIAPFFLFSAMWGQLADRFPKPLLIRRVKILEIGLMALATAGLLTQSPVLLFVVLFLLGAQSAAYSPLKFGLMPDILEEDELIGGNALMSAVTFLAILIGSITGSLLVLEPYGLASVAALSMLVAIVGWLASRAIPDRRAADPDLRLNYNLITETWRVVKHAFEDRPTFRSIVGISWFWLVGSVFIILFPAFAKDVLRGNQEVVALMLFVFSVGVALGSLACNKLLKGKVRDYYVPVGALGITVFAVDLWAQSAPILTDATRIYVGARLFVDDVENWRVLADLAGLAFCGGLYIVPLNAIVQVRAPQEKRARIIAANNILNALGMTGASVLVYWLIYEGATVPQTFLAIGLINIPVTLYVSYVVISDAARRAYVRMKALT
jgi:acyl-[acyl-carrier-protein]-phospholipid O-acyltransferase/long-chain-fatty-acid--[acyl-carrier-protein] ligase